MFVRKIALCVVLLCLLSLFVGLPFAEAHLGTKAEELKLDEAKDDLESALEQKAKLNKFNFILKKQLIFS